MKVWNSCVWEISLLEVRRLQCKNAVFWWKNFKSIFGHNRVERQVLWPHHLEAVCQCFLEIAYFWKDLVYSWRKSRWNAFFAIFFVFSNFRTFVVGQKCVFWGCFGRKTATPKRRCSRPRNWNWIIFRHIKTHSESMNQEYFWFFFIEDCTTLFDSE